MVTDVSVPFVPAFLLTLEPGESDQRDPVAEFVDRVVAIFVERDLYGCADMYHGYVTLLNQEERIEVACAVGGYDYQSTKWSSPLMGRSRYGNTMFSRGVVNGFDLTCDLLRDGEQPLGNEAFVAKYRAADDGWLSGHCAGRDIALRLHAMHRLLLDPVGDFAEFFPDLADLD